MKRKYIVHSDTYITIETDEGRRDFIARGANGRVYDATRMGPYRDAEQFFQIKRRRGALDFGVAVDCDGEALVDRMRRYFRREDALAKRRKI